MKNTTRRLLWLGLLAGMAAMTAACEKERPAYALTNNGRILGFDTAKPTKIDTEVRVSGLATNESLVQIDYRPANGTFYCLTSDQRLCTVDPRTGAVSLVSSTAFTTEDLVNPVIDFNPMADRLRVISTERNLRVNPNDGLLAATDTPVFYDSGDVNDDRSPQLAALAYDRNVSKASATTLFALDVATRSLVRVGSKNGSPDSPNTGRLFTIGQLPVSFTGTAGFDIEPDGDTAYAVLSAIGEGTALYRIDLSNGGAERVDAVDDGDRSIISLAIGPEEAGSNGN